MKCVYRLQSCPLEKKKMNQCELRKGLVSPHCKEDTLWEDVRVQLYSILSHIGCREPSDESSPGCPSGALTCHLLPREERKYEDALPQQGRQPPPQTQHVWALPAPSCAPPCLEPLGLPATWQPTVKDAAFEVSVCPASFAMAALCPLLKGRIGATPKPALKLGIMPQLHGAGGSGSGQKCGLEPRIR